MEIQIKKAVKAGNSSAVILPRSWLNKEVRVELVKKTPEIILIETMTILKKHISFDKVIGVYLVGSYARKEEDSKSDVDVLVISKKIDKEMIKEGIYSILIVSQELLKQKLRENLFPVGQMIKEAKPLLNSNYLDSIDVRVTEKNIKWYLDTTKDKFDLIKKVLDKSRKMGKEHLSDLVAYTLVLRIRTLYIIKKLIKNKRYSKKEFSKLIENISGGLNAYEGYLNIKNDIGEKQLITLKEAERLNGFLENQLIDVKKLV